MSKIEQAPQHGQSSLRSDLVAASICLVAYVGLEQVSFIHEYKGVPVTPWNPGLGVVFALMLARGARFALVLLAGAIVAEIVLLQSNLSWPVELSIAACLASGYGVAAWVARHRLQIDPRLTRLRDILALLAVGTAGACAVAAGLSLLLSADARLEWADALAAAEPLLIGDVIGIAVGTPLMLRFLIGPAHDDGQAWRGRVPEIAIFAAVVGVMLWLIASSEALGGLKLFHALFLPAAAAALRYGFDGACLALAVIQLELVGVLQFHGYNTEEFTDFQVLMLVLTATTLVVGIVVTERERASQAARAMRALLRERRADAAVAARHNLVSGMASAVAHEINQPMTAARALARSALQILRMPDPDLARADRNLSEAIEQVDHASQVVQRMREMLRRGRPHFSAVAVAAVIDDAVALVRSDAEDHAIRLSAEVEAGLPMLQADPVQLQQVLLNLVRNAIDSITAARSDGGEIALFARRSADGIEVTVRDDGAGVAPELNDRLFEPLTTTKPAGLGLGLAISASIIEAHGGRLWLHSGAPGATEFRFHLPLQPGDT